MAKVLVINCGSSSLKYQLIDMENESVVAKGMCDRIGIEGSVLTHKPTGKDKYEDHSEIKDHQVAVEKVMAALMDPEHGVIESTDEIAAIVSSIISLLFSYILPQIMKKRYYFKYLFKFLLV